MEKGLISIIIPIYNVKKFLRICVESVLAQSYGKLEIILVDDGSNDGSELICDEMKAKDGRVTVIHKPNSGVSDARNEGIRAAHGEFLMFVDSDDHIVPNACEVLINEAYDKNCQIVNADGYRVDGELMDVQKQKDIGIELPCRGIDFLMQGFTQTAMHVAPQYGIYRHELITDNGLYFESGIVHEDELWTPQVYLAAERVTYIPFLFYFHIMREGSITHEPWDGRHRDNVLTVCSILYERYAKLPSPYREVFLDYICTRYLDVYNRSKIKNGDKKLVRNLAHSRRNKIKALLYSVSPAVYFRINDMDKQRQSSD